MITKIPGVLRFVFLCEGVQTSAVNRRFSVNLVWAGAITSQLSVRQVRKYVVQGSEVVGFIVSDHSVNLFARLGALPRDGIFHSSKK